MRHSDKNRLNKEENSDGRASLGADGKTFNIIGRFFGSMAGFSLVWFIVALLVPVVWLGLADRLPAAIFIPALSVSTGIYFFLTSLSGHPLRIWAWMFPLTFLSAFQLVLLNLYGEGVIAVDMFLNVVTTNSMEVEELLSGLVPALSEVVVLYLGPLVPAFISSRRSDRVSFRLRYCLRRWGVMLMIAGLSLCIIMTAAGRGNPVESVFPLNAIENLSKAVGRWRQSHNYAETSRGYGFDSRSVNPDDLDETYVVVIGESSRAMNWELAGYTRSTNPRLSGRDDIFFFGKTLSESNTTHKSVPLLMSAIDSHTFNDSVYRVKSFIEAFNEAGFHTAFISAQQPAHSYIDHFASEADTHLFVDGAHDGTRTDFSLLSYLDRELSIKARKKFIVLHCYGSHYKYSDRYPGNMRVFGPDGPLESSPSYRERLVNAYDNSVLLTDSLLSGIISRLEGRPGISALVYTSDHGENIFDDSRNLFLHASPKTSFYQQHVPFLVWLSESYSAMHPSAGVALKANAGRKVSSSSSFFHTVLDIGGLESPVLRRDLSLGSSAYRSPAPVFINDHNEAVPMKEALSDPSDNALYHRLGY